MDPMSSSFDLTPFPRESNAGAKTSAHHHSSSLDYGRNSKVLFYQNGKKIKTPSFTTSEYGPDKKLRGSDLLLRHKEQSIIEPVMSLTNEELV